MSIPEPTRMLSALDAWGWYELRWSALSVASLNQSIHFRNIPWPLLSIPKGPGSITLQAVGAFILSPLRSEHKSRAERIRNAMLRWHSDKFEGRWMSRVEEGERSIAKEAVKRVHMSLIILMNGAEFGVDVNEVINTMQLDTDEVMDALLAYFEKERQRAELKRLEQVKRKRRGRGSNIWRTPLKRESDTDNAVSIVGEVVKLEREQAALARRIYELRAAAEANKQSAPAQPASVPPVNAGADQIPRT